MHQISLRLRLVCVFTLLLSGCAFRYHDARTGTEHVWGLAHVKMRVAPAVGTAPPAAVTQVETFGLGLHFTSGSAAASAPADGGFSLGWDRRTRLLVPDDATLSLEWPGAQLFDVRLGPASPSAPSLPSANTTRPSP